MGLFQTALSSLEQIKLKSKCSKNTSIAKVNAGRGGMGKQNRRQKRNACPASLLFAAKDPGYHLA
jgi:hypothetical protein